MEDKPDSLDNENTVQAGLPNETFRLRSYQAEMVEASLQENIIVAMDTGSGKTHM
jgi:ERCC4-related helicase